MRPTPDKGVAAKDGIGPLRSVIRYEELVQIMRALLSDVQPALYCAWLSGTLCCVDYSIEAKASVVDKTKIILLLQKRDELGLMCTPSIAPFM